MWQQTCILIKHFKLSVWYCLRCVLRIQIENQSQLWYWSILTYITEISRESTVMQNWYDISIEYSKLNKLKGKTSKIIHFLFVTLCYWYDWTSIFTIYAFFHIIIAGFGGNEDWVSKPNILQQLTKMIHAKRENKMCHMTKIQVGFLRNRFHESSLVI